MEEQTHFENITSPDQMIEGVNHKTVLFPTKTLIHENLSSKLITSERVGSMNTAVSTLLNRISQDYLPFNQEITRKLPQVKQVYRLIDQQSYEQAIQGVLDIVTSWTPKSELQGFVDKLHDYLSEASRNAFR